MNKYAKIPILIMSLLMASMSFGQNLSQSIKIPIKGKTLNFDAGTGSFSGTTELPVPDPLDYPFIDMDPIGGYSYMLYNGEPPLDVQQVVTNDRGELLFFIQDQMLYDYKGTAFPSDAASNGVDLTSSRIYCHSNDPNSDPGDYGTASFEFRIKNLQVVPLDGSCYRYLIMWHEVSNSAGGGGVSYNTIKYRIIAVLNDKSIVTISDNGNYDEDFYYNFPKTLIDFSGPSQGDNPTGFAFSESFNINERYLFVNSAENQLLTYKINSDNIMTYTPSIFSTYDFNTENWESEGNHFYEETELKKIGDYYYYVFAGTGTSAVQTSIGLHFFKINLQGHVVESITKNVGLSTNHEYIKGIEFSKNGDYLYFTQVGNVNLQYINTSFLFSNPVGTPPNIEEYISSSTDFQFSHIELARDGDMYLVDGNNGSLCSLENTDSPNTGSGLVINNNIGGVSNIPFNSNYSLRSDPADYDEIKNYILTKQVDGSDYTSYYTNLPENCCSSHFPYDVRGNYTVPSGIIETWDENNNPFRTDGITDIYLEKDLILESGADIKIEGLTLYFKEGYGIILNHGAGSTKGGKLTLDNSKCTAYDGCGNTDEMWKGILLDGNNTAQMPYSSTTQPLLVVRNNSTIEYAQRGIESLKGGIVFARNSTFKDNFIATRFSGYSQNQRSSMTKNTFLTTNELHDLKNKTWFMFSSIWLDKNIKYTGNSFINQSNLWGMGIDVYQGSVIVDHYCSDMGLVGQCLNERKNYFENLAISVKANQSSGCLIKNSEFVDNEHAVRIMGNSTSAQVIANDFDVANTGSDTYGLSVESSPYFIVQNNVFHDGRAGMYIIDNGLSLGEEIRHNEFSNLANGNNWASIIAKGNNGETGGLNDGLNIRCNKFENNDFAISVIDGNIAKSQYGDEGDGPSGNWFDHNHSVEGATDFYIENSPITNYNYHQHPYGAAQELRLDYDNDNAPNPYLISYGDDGDYYTYSDMSVSNLGEYQNSWESACPDQFPTGITVHPIGLTLARVDNFNNESDTKQDELDSKIDGGNTLLLQSKVDNLTQYNYYSTALDLIQVGPYLSDGVLNSFMDNSIYRPVAKTIVLIANSPLPYDSKQKIDNLNIPPYFKWYLKQLQNGQYQREKDELEISALEGQSQKLITNAIAFSLSNDSVPEKLDSLVTWLEAKDNLESYYRLTPLYIRNGEWDKATLTLEKIIAKAQLENSQTLLNAENYKTIQAINMQIMQNPINENSIIKNHQSVLEDIAELQGKEAGIAREMLYQYDSKVYADYKAQYPLPNTKRLANVTLPQPTENYSGKKEALISVFPNPTNGILNVEYINLDGNSTINIYDLKGTTLKSFKVEKDFGFNTYNVSDLSKGVYLIGFGKGQSTQFIVK